MENGLGRLNSVSCQGPREPLCHEFERKGSSLEKLLADFIRSDQISQQRCKSSSYYTFQISQYLKIVSDLTDREHSARCSNASR